MGSVAGDAAAPVVVVVVVETQGQRGVSEIRGAGSSMVDVKGMQYMLERRKRECTLHRIGTSRVGWKNGCQWMVVGRKSNPKAFGCTHRKMDSRVMKTINTALGVKIVNSL